MVESPPAGQSGLAVSYDRYRAQLRRLELRSRRAVDSEILGQYRSAFRGSGLVFSDLRPYEPGDDIKHIHWKVTARTGRPFVKSYEEDRTLRLFLIVDCSNSISSFGEAGLRRSAIDFAGLVTALSQQSDDPIGLALFAESVSEYLPPSRRLSQRKRILQQLLSTEIAGSRSDMAGALTEFARREKRRAIVFLISDFFCPSFERELALVAYRHDLVCVQLDHPFLGAMPPVGLVEFQDPESGRRVVVDTSNRAVRAKLSELVIERKKQLESLCRRVGADYLAVAEDPLAALRSLVAARMKRFR